jgi:hypothetical protein
MRSLCLALLAMAACSRGSSHVDPPWTPPPAVDASRSTVELDHASGALADGADAVVVHVRAFDAGGNPLADRPVGLAVTGSGNSLQQPGLTRLDGLAIGQLSSTVAERKTVTATVDGVQLAPASIDFLAPPTQLAFQKQPGDGLPGAALAEVAVALADPRGNLVPAASAKVDLALDLGGGAAALGGTLSRQTSSGVASFADLALDAPGASYRLIATAPGFAPVASAPFRIHGWANTRFGGAVSAIAADPRDNHVLWGVANSTVFRFAGGRWTFAGAGLTDAITSVAIDPNSPDVVYAAGPSSVWRWDGAKWASITAGLISDGTDHRLTLLAVPTPTTTLYVASDLDLGVHRWDQGVWTPLTPGLSTVKVAQLAYLQNYSDPIAVYAATDQGVFLYREADKAWYPLHGPGATCLLGNYDKLWECTVVGTVDLLSATYGWVSVSDYLSDSAVRLSMAPGGIAALAPSGRVYLSGRSWAAMTKGIEDRAGLDLTSSRADADSLYVATDDGVFSLSHSSASPSWTPLAPGLAAAQASAVVADPSAPGALWAAIDGALEHFDGAAWTRVSAAGAPRYIDSIAVDPASPGAVYAAGGDVSAGLSRFDGASWTSVYAGGHLHSLVADPRGGTLYAADAADGVFKFAIGGGVSAPGLGGADVRALALDSSGTLYATTYSGTFRLDGSTFTDLAQPKPPFGPNTSLVVDPAASGAVIVGSYSGLWRFAGGGWQSLAGPGGPTDEVWSLAIDPAHPQTLQVGTYTQGIFQLTGGTWKHLTDGLPPAADQNDWDALQVNGFAFARGQMFAGTNWGVYLLQ